MSNLDSYITEIKYTWPNMPRKQILAMIILHFDIPDKSADELLKQYELKEISPNNG